MHQIYWAFDKYTSNLNISMQLYLYQTFLWRTTKYHRRWTSNYLRSIWNLIQCNICTKFNERLPIDILFEHFIAIVYISVISIKNYQISFQLNFKLLAINLNLNSVQLCFKFVKRLSNNLRIWTFIAIVPIPVISIMNFRISLQLHIKLNPNNL